MSRTTDPNCPRTDVVLARFLDGHTREPSIADGELAAHLRGCPECQSSLRQARRLDALLAQHSHVDVHDALADRLLTAALPRPATTPRRPVALSVAAAILLSLGVAIGFWLRHSAAPDPIRRPHVPSGRDHVVEVEHPESSGSGMRLPAASRSRFRVRSVARRPDTDTTVLHRTGFGRELLPGVVLAHGLRQLTDPTAPLPTWQSLHHTAQQIAITMRVRAGQHLLQSRSRKDHRDLREFLATAADGPVLRTLLASVHEDPTFVRSLEARLSNSKPDTNDVRIAARVGHPRVDVALRRLARRKGSSPALIANAVTQLEMRPGRVPLLLDLWSETSTESMRTWFRALPAVATAELVTVANTTNRAERRLHAIAALGWRRDIACLEFLFRQVDGHDHDSVLAAGHAISRLPRAATEPAVLARLKRSRRPHVLLAALCGMQSEWPLTRMRTTDLTREETDFLRAGVFTPKQFDIACSLCRRRTLSNH